MKERYQKLNVYYKTGIWSLIIVAILAILLIPLFFFKMMDIPLGIVLGGGFASVFYFLTGLNQRKEYDRSALKIDIILIISRLIIFAAALVGLALLYYLAGIKIFNIFSFAGSYLLTLLIYLFISRKEGKQ